MPAVEDDIQYDSYRRMLYHPCFHHNHKQPWTEEDLEYLCKFWGFDERRTLSFALGRPESALDTKVGVLKKEGLFLYYKKLNKHW
ncbi:hypothetical protein J2S74_002281 [Evansella vedderi]|uniref:DNA-entry nuclease n=1 Tax=Evansella vedderi TaxID=38282 RepID=A0ABT9ZUK8_9BACI|nr:DNA-entry nuclease [Evansella vedderi]MDQ0254899.1 hypothetical protein [Evansella vedderi]